MFGSGFVVRWRKHDGQVETRIVTNNHVMGGALEAEIISGDPALAGNTDDRATTRRKGWSAVLIQASGAVNDMVQLTRDLKSITGGMARGEGTVGQLLTNRSLYDELNGTLARTNALVTRLQAPNGSFAKLLDDPALYQNLNGMIGSVDSLVRQMRSENGTLGRLLSDDTLYTHLVGITAGADSLVKQLTRGNGFAAKLVNDQQLYEQLTKTITDLNAILADVRQNPGRYTKGMIKVF